ncbi:MAG: AmmeMemoRadiSam system radical SAM enzyme [Denitrovibrio sp.]|nr:MAG: AmmeMemoRadiSam system radical SAM enzyme [Denitrovibrio sp.]
MGVPAKYWEKVDNNKVRCLLCPHQCLINDSKSGLCLIRKNIDGILQQTSYGQMCSASFDPIEKKPLYHFHPGKDILSIGSNGCNMKCRHCQNWEISTKETNRQEALTDKLLKLSNNNNSIGIAYTYNEPIVWFEFIYDCAKVFKEAGQANVLVSNGQINSEPLAELIPYIDAANIDLKGFTEEFYKNEGGYLKTTMNTIETMTKAGVHLELTNLVILTLNDDPKTFEEMCRYISHLSKEIPLHLSRYFPQHKSEIKLTPNDTLIEFRNIANKYLNYVYLGNVSIKDGSNTNCPNCDTILIQRSGYKTDCLTRNNICPNCSAQLSILF